MVGQARAIGAAKKAADPKKAMKAMKAKAIKAPTTPATARGINEIDPTEARSSDRSREHMKGSPAPAAAPRFRVQSPHALISAEPVSVPIGLTTVPAAKERAPVRARNKSSSLVPDTREAGLDTGETVTMPLSEYESLRKMAAKSIRNVGKVPDTREAGLDTGKV